MKCPSSFILTLILCILFFSCNQTHEKPVKAIPKKSVVPVKESPKTEPKEIPLKKTIPKKNMEPLKKATKKQRKKISVDTLLPKITR